MPEKLEPWLVGMWLVLCVIFALVGETFSLIFKRKDKR